jgi:hypothetical protein
MANNWLPEAEAAKKINRQPRTLRKKVKSGAWNVAYRAINNRFFQYNEKDLERLYEERRSA